MATRFIDKEFGADSTTAIADDATGRLKVKDLPDAAGLVIDKVDGFIKYNDGGTIRELVNKDEAQTLTNKTLTSPTITGATITDATITGPVASEIVTATNVIAASESGKTFFLTHATEFASTLPPPAQGLFFRFIVADAPDTASYTVVTDSAAQILAGKVFGADGEAGDVESTATGTTITFVADVSVVGDMAEVWSDGTSWFARCFTDVATAGITITG